MFLTNLESGLYNSYLAAAKNKLTLKQFAASLEYDVGYLSRQLAVIKAKVAENNVIKTHPNMSWPELSKGEGRPLVSVDSIFALLKQGY